MPRSTKQDTKREMRELMNFLIRQKMYLTNKGVDNEDFINYLTGVIEFLKTLSKEEKELTEKHIVQISKLLDKGYRLACASVLFYENQIDRLNSPEDLCEEPENFIDKDEMEGLKAMVYDNLIITKVMSDIMVKLNNFIPTKK